MLPQHRPYDCTIEVQEGAQSPFGPIYGLFQNELAALREYFDENLAKNFIQHSKSPIGTPILFVKKKMALFGYAWTTTASTKSPFKTGIHYLLFLDFSISLVKQRFIQKLTFEELIIWCASRKATNGRLHSGQGMDIWNIMLCLSVLSMPQLFFNIWWTTSFTSF